MLICNVFLSVCSLIPWQVIFTSIFEVIMIDKLKVVAAITALMMFTACSDSSTDVAEQTVSEEKVSNAPEQKATQATVQSMPSYEIIEDDVKRDIKRTVEVELSSRTDEETLKALAEQIYALSNAKVKRTFIGYRIAGEDKRQAFWAKTDYDPDLKVIILGKNPADYEAIKNIAPPNGEILGSWMVGDGIDYKITAYNKDGKTYIQTIYDESGSLDIVYNLSESDKGIKLQSEDERDSDSYYIINEKGDLEFWHDELGNYYTTTQKV